MKTQKGYTLTLQQIQRRSEFVPYLVIGPGCRRDIRDNLASLEYAEDSAQVDYWLEQADQKTYDFR